VAHLFVGPRAHVTNLSSQGYGDPVRLSPGKSATASFGASESGNYTPSTCVAKKAQSLSVGLGQIGNWWVRLAVSVCTKRASTSIGGVVPSGQVTLP
jgi:hypothetical protein